jgi:hypothetical protein
MYGITGADNPAKTKTTTLMRRNPRTGTNNTNAQARCWTALMIPQSDFSNIGICRHVVKIVFFKSKIITGKLNNGLSNCMSGYKP